MLFAQAVAAKITGDKTSRDYFRKASHTILCKSLRMGHTEPLNLRVAFKGPK